MSHWGRRIKATLGLDEPLQDLGAWEHQVEEMLYEGESVSETFALDSARVVVTSHRVLTFTPEMDGAHFEQVERPNVTRVRRSAVGESENIARGVKYGVIGLVLFVAGSMIDFGGIVGDVNLDSEGAGQLGIGGTLGMINQMLAFIAQIDDLMRTFGLLALFLAVVMFGVYALTREATFVLEVAGGEDVHLPRPEDAQETLLQLEAAIAGQEAPDPVETPQDPLEER